jgi:hypothetical protein
MDLADYGKGVRKELRMFSLDQLRRRQEQRLSLALESWNEAKEHLQKAMALAAAKEQEYREVSEDVRRRLDAMELVSSMARELGEEVISDRSLNAPENQPRLMPPNNPGKDLTAIEKAVARVAVRSDPLEPPAIEGRVRKSSRPLFTSDMRSELARLSILQ